MMWELEDVAGISQLAEEYAVSRSTMVNWTNLYPDFPTPLTVIGGRRVWSRTQVNEWVTANCYQLPEKPS